MSETSKAVFLSYASQDAEAARRICAALRVAGVEVWFDQSELRGGDAWDQKIRKQIKDCALFVPVISANTQARREGYFRLEWRLAVERMQQMDDDLTFLLPVVIDDTTDAAARVPDKFREVQWTRLSVKHTPESLAARVATLIGGAGEPEPAVTGGRGQGPGVAARKGGWKRTLLTVGLPIFGVALAMLLLLRDREAKPAAVPPVAAEFEAVRAGAKKTASAAPTGADTPARELVAKARELFERLEATPADFMLAEDYCQRALKLDDTDAEVWAALASTNSAFVYRGFDRSPERMEKVRTAAERAIRLAPRSFHARTAQASAWSTFGVNQDGVEKTLRELVEEQPENKAVLKFLASVILRKGAVEEAMALNARAAAMPGGDPLALYNNARAFWDRGHFADGYATMQAAAAQQPFVSALAYLLFMEMVWRGDLDRAEATLKRIPETAWLEDRINYHAGLLMYYRGRPEEALRIWRLFPRDYFVDLQYQGSKGGLLGLAHEAAGRPEAARIEWRAALQVVQRRLATNSSDAQLYVEKASLHAYLGENAAADEAYRSGMQLADGRAETASTPIRLAHAVFLLRLGRIDEVVARLDATLRAPRNALIFPAQLRLDPRLEPLRRDARVKELLERYPLPEAGKK